MREEQIGFLIEGAIYQGCCDLEPSRVADGLCHVPVAVDLCEGDVRVLRGRMVAPDGGVSDSRGGNPDLKIPTKKT